jgi:hypothetical protein
LLVAPTSTSARSASFRPVIDLGGLETRVLVEQTAAVNPVRLAPPSVSWASRSCARSRRHFASCSSSERSQPSTLANVRLVCCA